jgi:hypothetical protein
MPLMINSGTRTEHGDNKPTTRKCSGQRMRCQHGAPKFGGGLIFRRRRRHPLGKFVPPDAACAQPSGPLHLHDHHGARFPPEAPRRVFRSRRGCVRCLPASKPTHNAAANCKLTTLSQANGVRVERRARRQRDPHPSGHLGCVPLAAAGLHGVQHRGLLPFGLSLEAGGRQATFARLHGRHLRRPGHQPVGGRWLPVGAHTVARRPRMRASARRLQVAARARAELPAQCA